MPDPTDTPDPLQSLTEIAERCQLMVRQCNPSRFPVLASDVSDLCGILQAVIRRLDARDSQKQLERTAGRETVTVQVTQEQLDQLKERSLKGASVGFVPLEQREQP